MKKIKKLVLNKSFVSNLSPTEKNQIKGGTFYGMDCSPLTQTPAALCNCYVTPACSIFGTCSCPGVNCTVFETCNCVTQVEVGCASTQIWPCY